MLSGFSGFDSGRLGVLGFFTFGVWALGMLAPAPAFALSVDDLRVEYLPRPLGVDAARPRLSWVLHASQRAQRQAAYRVIVASSEAMVARETGDVWDSGVVRAAENFGIEFAGPTLASGTRYFWRVRVWDAEGRASDWSEAAWWQMGLLAPSDWRAKWIGGAGTGSPLLRREFRVEKPIVRATAHAYAAGWYRLVVNGTELTERVLAPVNSNYPKGLFYDTYDVTPWLKAGANAVGLWLGAGYAQSYSQYGYRWNIPPAALAQIDLVFSDGTTATIATDGSWRTSESPITADDIYHGETYDARLEQAGWSVAGFDDHAWKPAIMRDAPAGPLLSCPFPGIAVAGDLRPVTLSEPKPGVWVFDLGQNIAGRVRLQVKGPTGTTVVLRHAEDVHADGTLDVTTNRKALATDTYILRGQGDESYEPRFTYHGFRYVEVTGYPGRPTLDSLTGRAVHAALEPAGTFRCSDPLINRIHQNFRWSIANNLMGIPTDTATRDERTPCQMDSLAVEEAAIANFGMDPYYAKWLHDIAGDGGTLPSWTGDQVVLPYLLYLHYGDRRMLERHFANMRQVVDTFTAKAEESAHWATGFGDWATANQPGDYETSFSEGELVGRVFHYRSARIVADVATVLGASADAERYGKLAEQIRAAFEARLYHPETATYSGGRQVTSVLPLAFGMVSPANEAAVAEALRRRVEEKDRAHLDAGIFGTRYLFDVLIDHGSADLAARVLTNPGYPGYADQIAQGATTTWEQWTFRGSMQTHDHAMFAGPDATLYSRFGGIQPAAPGYREIIIRPALPVSLSEVECTRQTVMGKIACHWKRHDGGLTVRVSIPVNASAQIHLPAHSLDHVREGGRPAAQADGVAAARLEGNSAVLTIGSGDYEFAVDAK